ncbi:MAG: DUF11 domain-containing protein [Candidatus Kerfeldbacteria bacterium]|nr:DUF11 domain-containing protein [Candidatus Kerfeldbacteria bacterium]
MKRAIVRTATVAAVAASMALAITAYAQEVVGPSPEQPVALTKPVLEVTKTADLATAKPGDIVTYTVTVKNAGTSAALGLKLADILPIGFEVTTNGKNTFDYTFLGNLEPGQTVSTSYSARVINSIAANGQYTNVATVSASNHDPVTVRATTTVNIPVVQGTATERKNSTTEATDEGQVLGAEDELPATGVGQLDAFLALLGTGLVGAGLIGLRRTRRV